MVRVTEGASTPKVLESRVEGKGTEESPYIITDVTGLQAINESLTSVFELKCDIDGSETKEWNGGKGFEPIGRTEHQGGEPFSGYLKGNGHTITNIHINRPNTHNIGLFGVIDDHGIVDEIALENSEIRGRFTVGSIVGYNAHGNVVNSEIDNITVTGNNVVGGVVGWNRDESSLLKIKSGKTFVKGKGCIGGIAGENSGYIITVDMSKDTCSIGERYIGNFCGLNEGNLKPNQ